jgi:hypothetical protein
VARPPGFGDSTAVEVKEVYLGCQGEASHEQVLRIQISMVGANIGQPAQECSHPAKYFRPPIGRQVPGGGLEEAFGEI